MTQFVCWQAERAHHSVVYEMSVKSNLSTGTNKVTSPDLTTEQTSFSASDFQY